MSRFRIGVGRIWQECNSFSCVATKLADYQSAGGIAFGDGVLDQPTRRDEVTGFLDVLAADQDVEVAGLLNANALPSGCATDEVVAFFEDTLGKQLHETGPLDGICFALHGANSALSVTDLDGHFLRIIRDMVGKSLPIVCTLDFHAIVTQQMLDFGDVFFAYRTHPHVDLVETGRRAARVLLRQLQGKCKPVMSYQRVPLLLPPPDEGTHAGPLKRLFDTFIAWDQIHGVIGCSLCCSYPFQDVNEQGWLAMAVTDDNAPLGDKLVSQLAEQAWKARHHLLPKPMLPADEAIQQAIAVEGCPVVITDSADTVGAGAPGDTTDLLHQLLDMHHKVDGLILIHIPDPEAISAIKASAQVSEATVDIGAKRDLRYSQPSVTVTGCVMCITEGPINDDGHFGTDQIVETGSIVCLGVDNVRIVLTDRIIMGPQPSLFRKVGIEPFEAKIVALKTGVGVKPTYGDMAKAIFRADCPGASSYNFHHHDYQAIRRPIFPLDTEFCWRPESKLCTKKR